METYTITEPQYLQISRALSVAISVCLVHNKDFTQDMIDAANLLDDIVNDSALDNEGEA